MSDSPSASPSTSAVNSAQPPVSSSGDGEVRSVDSTSDNLGQSDNDQVTKQAKPAPVESDDDEIEFLGEKLKRREAKAMRDRAAKAAEIERGAHEKFRKNAEERKAWEAQKAEEEARNQAIWENLDKDPYAFHRAKGMTDEQIDRIAEERLVKQMKRAQMTPEQIEAEQLKQKFETVEQENARLKQEAEERANEQKQAKFNEAKQHFHKHWGEKIAEGMKLANLPKTTRTAAQVAGIIAEYAAQGQSIEPAIAARIVRDESRKVISHELTDLFESNPEAAVAYLPKELVAYVLKTKVQQAQEFVPQNRKQPSPPKPPKSAMPPTLEEAREAMRAQGLI